VSNTSRFLSPTYIYISVQLTKPCTQCHHHPLSSFSSSFLSSQLTNQVNSQNAECLSCIASETCFKSDTAPQAADDDSCTPCAPATSTGGAGQNWWPCSVAGQCECRGSAALVFYTILLRQQPYDDIGEDQMQTIATASNVATLLIGFTLKLTSGSAVALENEEGIRGDYDAAMLDVILVLLLMTVLISSLVMTAMTLPCFASKEDE